MTDLFISVPIYEEIDGGDKPAPKVQQQTPKDGEEQSRIVDAARVLAGKREIKADPDQLAQQLNGYIEMVQGSIISAETKSDAMRVSKVTLGLTITGGANIGIASTEAEASIQIEFSRPE